VRLRKRISKTWRAILEAATAKSEPRPAVQTVPEAICVAADHWPLAQRWKEVPAMQFHCPSSLQAPLKVLELPLELVLLEDEEATGAASVDDVAVSETVGVLVSAGAEEVVAAAAAEEVSVGALLAAADDSVPEEELELELEESDEPEAVSPEPAKVAVPVQAAEPSAARLAGSPSYSTTSPGWGKRMSTPSLVVQPLMLATNIGGKLAVRFSTVGTRLSERLEEPLVTVTGAQFIYISRLPIRLNQVQARVYLPASIPSGMVKLNE
jgi:hypothetical protein